jgi:phosphoglycerol transferase MdoB-like AlkP superfamily enzyme
MLRIYLRLLWLWAPLAIATPVAKLWTLDEEGYRLLAASLGRATQAGEPFPFTTWEQLSFCRGDLLLVLVAAPLCILTAARWVSMRWLAPLVAAATAVGLLFLYTEAEFYRQVGRFQSIELIVDGILWGWDNSHLAGQFIELGPLVAWGAVALALAVLAWRIGWRDATEVRFTAKASGRLARAQRIAAGIAGAMMVVAAWLVPIETTAWHKSLFRLYVEDYLDLTTWRTSEFASLAPSELEEEYRRLTSAPATATGNDHFGVARGHDVILFVMETGPARCLPADDVWDDLPNVKRLRERAWVAARHHSTYPYTSRAIFSLLTSWYPTNAALDYIERDRDLRLPGLVQSLRREGYATAVYLPAALSFTSDRRLLAALGFQRQLSPEITPVEAEKRHRGQPSWQVQRTLDEAALAAWKRDLEANLSRGRRSVTMFLPQIGHAPWPDVTGQDPKADVTRRGRAIMRLQDAWLGEIMDVLAKYGRLEKTIIVFTADHGLRNRQEYPDLASGALSADSFHVPLVIYAPGAVRESRVIPWVTSHIDVAPSVLELLGVQHGRESEQGGLLWDRRLEERTTFLFAHHYRGSDGYFRRGQFHSWNSELGIGMCNSRLAFDPRHVVTPREAEETRRLLARMSALQDAWVAKWSATLNDARRDVAVEVASRSGETAGAGGGQR